jgi:hypothetical protein
MSRLRLIGWCLVAALAFSALAASSAWAEAPEYGRCLKAEKNAKKEYNGKFSDSKCTKEVPEAERAKKGKYTWVPGAESRKFTSSGGIGVLETVGGTGTECKSESSTGEFAPGNNKEEKGIVVTFKNCVTLDEPCSTPGAAEGEIVTNELEAIVGWENKARKKTDVMLSPAKSVKSGLFTEFSCTGLVIKVRGHVLVPIKNDKMTSHETLKFKATKGKQKPEKWEGAPATAILEANFGENGWEQAGQTITATITGEEQLELNAVI